MNMNFVKKNKNRGFTLLELLIVIAIIAILSVALVLVLNPAETLKKARDAQRISDLATLKTAIGLYLTSVSPAYLGGVADNNFCKPTPATAWGDGSFTYKISYSTPIAVPITDAVEDGSTGVIKRQAAVNPSLTDGTGWIPVKFDNITGGSPISNIPLDPTNNIVSTLSTAASVRSDALVYRYACAITPLTFEIDAQLESDAYTVTDDKRASDGGNSTLYYEVGTSLSIMTAASPSAVGTDI
ncbi:MAG: prepilin-type N-terminal cleavage/methylation domain-containing protein [Minisyncoccia bacterium]